MSTTDELPVELGIWTQRTGAMKGNTRYQSRAPDTIPMSNANHQPSMFPTIVWAAQENSASQVELSPNGTSLDACGRGQYLASTRRVKSHGYLHGTFSSVSGIRTFPSDSLSCMLQLCPRLDSPHARTRRKRVAATQARLVYLFINVYFESLSCDILTCKSCSRV